jgi:small subunit ribosomal protein S4e
MILRDKEGNVKVNGKVRRDDGFPVGVMDVLSLEKTGEHFRLLRDVAGRFVLKTIKAEESKFKLCRVKAVRLGTNKIPYIYTDDGRTFNYPHPEIQINDTVKVDLDTGKVLEFFKCEPGNLVFVTGGNNIGRVGLMLHRERHLGSFDIVHVKDANGKLFSTR